MNFIEIQSWPEIPSIAHLISLFSSTFDLPDFDIEDLEEAFLCDSSETTNSLDTELVPRLVPELIVSLLKGCDLAKSWPNISTSNYQMFLRRLFRKKCEEYNIENPFNEDTDFHSLSLRTKVVILNLLCDFRLDSADVERVTANIEADSLRIEPLGYDNNESAYWYFFGTRLYREDFKKNSKKGQKVTNRVWQVICFSEEDWTNLTNKFKKSKSLRESALFKTLSEDFLPNIPELFKAKEQERRRRLFQRRTSSRVKVFAERERVKIHNYKSPSDSESQPSQSYTEKFLLQKKRETEELHNVRDKIRNERAVRALRRSRSTSTASGKSTYAGSEVNSHAFTHDLRFDSADERILEKKLVVKSKELILKDPPLSCKVEDKENILNPLKEIKRKRHRQKESDHLHSKMPPTTTTTKLPGRQTNNSLSSITGQIVIQAPPTPVSADIPVVPTTSRKKKTKTEVNNVATTTLMSLSFTETDEVLQIGMHKVLEYIKNHGDAWPFMDPVEEDIAPRYYSIIRRPMDLLKMEEKLDNGEYQSFIEFRNDFKLIVNNCRLYNGQNNGNEYTEMVNNLQIAFERATKKYFDSNSSDEEPNAEYPVDLHLSQTQKDKVIVVKDVKKEKTANTSTSSSSATKDKKSSSSKHLNNSNSKKKISIESDNDKDDAEEEKVKKTVDKSEKVKSVRGVSLDKSKEKSTKGVKRKRKDKDKSAGKHAKKMRKDVSDNEADGFMTDDDDDRESEVFEDSDFEEIRKESVLKKSAEKPTKKVEKSDKKVKKTVERTPSPVSDERTKKTHKKDKKNKKSEIEKTIKVSKKERTPSVNSSRSRSESPVKAKKNSAKKVKEKVKNKSEDDPKKSKKDKKKKELEISSDNESIVDYPAKKHNKKDKDKETNDEEVKKNKKDKDKETNDEEVKKNKKNTSGNKKEKEKEKEKEKIKQPEVKKKPGRPAATTSTPKKINNKSPTAATVVSSLTEPKSASRSKSSAKKPDIDEDMMSVSSQSFSRSPSPLPSIHSSRTDDFNNSNSFDYDNDASMDSKKLLNSSSRSFTPEIKDKFDLIKERRRAKNQPKEQLDKTKDQKSAKVTSKPGDVKDKNQKLKETIEKLKMKSEKSKNTVELMDEILGGKPAKPGRSEKASVFDKLKSTTPKSKDVKKEDEYNFVDDEVPGPAKKKPKTDKSTTKDSPSPSKKQKKVKEEKVKVEKVKEEKKEKKEKEKKEKKDEKKEKKEAKKEEKIKKESKKEDKKSKEEKKSTPVAPETPIKANEATISKQNKANLEILDLETEQTLKDINKWLEHTPRFEFNSASNSPSRYIIDDLDVPAKIGDDGDFRKPIPILPSSPTPQPSGTVPPALQSPGGTNKDFNLLKESNNNKQSGLVNNNNNNIQNSTQPPSTSNKKALLKDPSKTKPQKSLKEKLQSLPRKKELQRTIDRLQPGKTKGNLLSNIQNINKPEDMFPLGNPSKMKEVKNSLIVKTDESSPKLSLGTVLDNDGFGLGSNFNFNDDEKKEDEMKEETKEEKDEDKPELSLLEGITKDEELEENSKKSDDGKEALKELLIKSPDPKSPEKAKPNLNAWFKAFGVPKKPEKKEDEKMDLIDKSDAPVRQRKLSTGSSVSERSSVEDSPQVAIEERIGAPVPYPSPIGASPIMASPKTDDLQKTSLAATSTYPLNGSTRVGFYQDMTSTKSSPDKSCSPREMPSPYNQYSQHIYSATPSATSPNVYGNYVYNPDASAPNKGVSYSKPTTSPASYYDQYKQPMSQESEFNNSMSPSTNPNSPYHSQQSSPYQQQPHSPYQQNNQFQSGASSGSNPGNGNGNGNSNNNNNAATSQAPNSPYSQPNSPYQQPQVSPYHQQQQQPTPQQQKTTQHHSPNAPQFTNPSSPYAQHGPHSPYSQQQHTQATATPATFPTKPQNQQKPTSVAPEWQNKINPANFNVTANQQQQGNFQMTQQQQQIQNPGNAINPQMAHHMDTNYQNQVNYQKKAEQTSGTPATTSLYGTNAKNLPEMINVGYSGMDVTPKLIPPNVPKAIPGEEVNIPNIVNKPVDNNKYLDLSKQHHTQAPVVNTQDQQQYHQQMFDLSNYGKQPKPAAYDDMKNNTKMYDFLNRSKAFPTSTAPASCAATAPNIYGNINPAKTMDTTPAPYNNNQVNNKIDLTTKSSPTLNNLLNAPVAAGVGSNNFPNNMSLHQNIHQNKPHEAPKPAAELNIPNMRFGANQQPNMNPAFNPSVMNFASFMQNFQADDRMLGMPGQTPASYYDKNISPAHMFSKNLPQNSSAALQQMFNTTMASYGVNREQQQNMNMNYQNRLATTPQAAPQAVVPPPQVPETKAKRPRKKKNATPTIQTPEIPPINPAHQQGQQNQQMAHQQQAHQQQAHQQQHQHALSVHQQQLAHQGFQSYSGLGKAPGAPGAVGGEASAISLKGSAFNYGPAPLPGLYGENPNYLDEFRGTPNHFYTSALSHRSTPDPIIDKSANPPQAHPPPPSSPYHHLLAPHHPSRSSYPYIDPAAMQQYRMIHSYQAGYHPLGMQHQPPHWHM